MTGLKICLLGPDGVGKGTIIKTLGERFTIKYFHLYPVPKHAHSAAGEGVSPRQGVKVYSVWLSYLKVVYFFGLYNICWFFNVYLSRQNTALYVFDRYLDDMLVDPRRFLYSGKLWVVKLLLRLVVKPDLYFVLLAEPEKIHSRKQELPVSEISEQLMRYKDMVDGNRYIAIDANGDIESVINQVNSYLGK